MWKNKNKEYVPAVFAAGIFTKKTILYNNFNFRLGSSAYRIMGVPCAFTFSMIHFISKGNKVGIY
ncbi:hypothetical protein CWO92_24225 [Heyndrickxia camelliae]|uniref:Uncharacterized protein n=1 Tax=Heyndrickxia camelliae TaxID=1707093 RepID=A0A2N3LCZ6_9BACI|nr:hypothetical protein CWO92_24225 [Heyndrickxia camelliae]